MHSRRKLRRMTTPKLRIVAKGLGIEESSRKDLLRAILKRYADDTPPPTRWCDAMRRLRTFKRWGLDRDDEISSEAERSFGLRPGRATTGDLNKLFDQGWQYEESQDYATVPSKLTRSEALTELAKTKKYVGKSILEVEEEVPRAGRTATYLDIMTYLDYLGGPSSSSPERTLRTFPQSVEELESHWGVAEDEVLTRIGATRWRWDFKADQAAESILTWGRDPPPRLGRTYDELLDELVALPRFRGLSSQEVVDEIEAEGGAPASLENVLQRRTPPPEEPERFPPLKDSAWWNAMRKVRTLLGSEGKSDSDLISAAAKFEGVKEVTTRILGRFFDHKRYWGLRSGAAPTRKRLTRRGLLCELAKFERYGSEGSVIEGLSAMLGRPPRTRDMAEHLTALGGSSSYDPEGS